MNIKNKKKVVKSIIKFYTFLYILNMSIYSNMLSKDTTTYKLNVFFNASKNGKIEIINELLSSGMDINTQDEDGNTILILAINNKKNELVKELLKNPKIDINSKINMYHYSADTSIIKTNKDLLKSINNDLNKNKYELSSKIKYNIESSKLEILDSIKNTISSDFYEFRFENKKSDVYIRVRSSNFSNIYGRNSWDLYSEDYENKYIKDNEGMTALMRACYIGNKDIVKELLKNPNININSVDEDGYNALMLSTRQGNIDIVKELLKNPNIDINNLAFENSGNYDWSALMIAARYGYYEIAQELLKNPNIDINIQKNDGWNALMISIANNNVKIAKLLLNHPKINPNLYNEDSNTIWELASSKTMKEISIFKNKNK